MNSSPRWLLALCCGVSAAAVSLLVACGDGRGAAGRSAASDPSDGPIVITGAGGAGAEHTGAVVETLRLGTTDTDGPELFGEIRALAVAADGEILIFDHFGNELRRFDARGRFVSSLGGTGQGPGEFLSVVGLAIDPSGDTWLVDVRNQRYSVASEDSVLRVVARPARVATQPWLGGFDREGFLHELALDPGGPDGELQARILRIDPEGEVVSEHPIPHVTIPTPTLGAGIMVPLPFLPTVLRAWDPAGAIWQAVSTDSAIVRIDLAGDTTHVVHLDRSAPPLNGAEQDSVRRAIHTVEGSFGINVAAEVTPTVMPLLRWFTVDDEGNLWVCATAREPCDVLDVYDPGTGAHGTVSLPVVLADHPVPRLRGGAVHGVTEGPLGEPYLFVGRLPPPWSSGRR